MYIVIKYNDYKKEQKIEILNATEDKDEAKRVAYTEAVKAIPKDEGNKYRITTKVDSEYIEIKNNKIISYKIVRVKEYKDSYKIEYSFSTVYTVIELKDRIRVAKEIDMFQLCDKYYEDNDEDE